MKKITGIALLLCLVCVMYAQENNSLKIGNKTPAGNSNEALPAGNGRFGAMMFGGVSLQLVELDLSGLPTNARRYLLRKGNSDPQLFALFSMRMVFVNKLIP